MRVKGLNKLYWLNKEIEEIRMEIDNLSELSSPSLSGMPHSNSLSNPPEQYYLKKEKLITKLNKKLEKYIDELIRIENIIDLVDDPEIRVLARKRFIENKDYSIIAQEVFMDRTTVSRKLKNYFERKKRDVRN